MLAQEKFNTLNLTDTLLINFQNVYEIRSVSIVPLSEKISIQNRLLEYSDYNFNYMKGTFSLSDSLVYSIMDTIIVSYETLLTGLKREYKRRTLVTRYDDLMADTVRVIKVETSPITAESIFGEGIRSSGSIVRGFDVSTNKDFSINSGLRLQLNGKLSDDLDIVAALTDENTPIQPEGNTETLEELDKVFIEVRHPNAIGTFGDFDLTIRKGEFSTISRKLQGLKANLNINGHLGMASIAGARGKFTTNQFNGTDGNQGPYRLSGGNNERDLIVIAGSERVYLDGERMKRGENADFVIEYANAELTFTSNRLITSASRITIDFEYTLRQYRRNFIAAGYGNTLFDSKLNFDITYMRETDSENSPIDIVLSEEDKELLSNAGDNQVKAAKSGVTLVEPDSTGRRLGTYTKIDTVINGDDFTYYIYDPGAEESIYNVDFSFIAQGFGHYNRISTGNYEFVGIGEGSYLPVTLLPMPEDKHSGAVLMKFNPMQNLSIDLELAGSIYDKNKFSDMDNENNQGYARNLKIDLKPGALNIFSVDLGKIGFLYRDRYVENTFSSIDRINAIEFNRDYNISQSTGGDEILREASLYLEPVEQLKINGMYGFLQKGNDFSSDRIFTDIKLANLNQYNGDFELDYVNTNDRLKNSDWMKQEGQFSYMFGKIVPGVFYIFEERKESFLNSDSLINSSHKFIEAGPKLSLIKLGGFDFTARYSVREESFPIDGDMTKESFAVAQNYRLGYKGIKEFQTTFNFTYRNREITKEFEDKGHLDNETYLIRNQSKFNFWNKFISGDLFYDAATKKTAKLEKVFIRVQPGRGNYIYLGDLNDNGIADEEEFLQTAFEGDYILTFIPTDDLFPVIELRFNTRWRVEFKRILKSTSFFSSLINPLSTETSFRIDENSEEEDVSKILLLDLDHFLNDSTTLRGSQIFQHDFHLFRNKREFSIRFRFLERNLLSQFSSGLETGYGREKSVRLRFKMIKEINNETEYINKIDNVMSEGNETRNRQLSSDEILTNFSYRPLNHIEFGFKISVGRTTDYFPENPTIIDNNLVALRFTWSFAGRGLLRIEAERDELTTENSDNYIPFELTRGKTIGINYTWRLNFDYKFASLLQVNFNYNGRLQGSGDLIHGLGTEARAYF